MYSLMWFSSEGRKVYSCNVLLTNGLYKTVGKKKLYITAKTDKAAIEVSHNLNYNRGIADERNEDGSINAVWSEQEVDK